MPPPTWRSQALHNLADSDVQGDGDKLQRSEGHALLPAFEPIKVGPVESGELRQVILGDPLSLADSSDAFPDCPVDVLQATRLGGMLLLGTLLKSNTGFPSACKRGTIGVQRRFPS